MRKKIKKSLAEKYPPSPPCSCNTCLNYCKRPGWWTVAEAERAIAAGYGYRMMLEMSPEFSFGVLSPAFKGCEKNLASNLFSGMGCTFLIENRCELHGTVHQPLECRFCHHSRKGLGQRCHRDIEKEWDSPEGKALINQWIRITGIRKNY
jgi:hypothetical protein